MYWQTFELAWKAMKSVLQLHGVDGAKNDSPREVIKLGFAFGFVDDEASWLAMLRDRNTSAHEYNEEMAELVLERIQIQYISTLEQLRITLAVKIAEAEETPE
ncbi:MAG: HI0074 family nucleotidyltransferase substrate-binding subunit [Planctomycetia bacterium]|nr:HI0074 family nucleotidyltransferase substrate-binding subunit [Planctomycetia bacterium]